MGPDASSLRGERTSRSLVSAHGQRGLARAHTGSSRGLLYTLPTPRDAVAYMMETFPIVKKKDIAAHGVYRTKERILGLYDLSIWNAVSSASGLRGRDVSAAAKDLWWRSRAREEASVRRAMADAWRRPQPTRVDHVIPPVPVRHWVISVPKLWR